MSPAPVSAGIHSPGQGSRWTMIRYEWLACAIVIVGLIVLRIHFVSHVGGLWRDEVHSVDVARNPLFPMWQDSFPILWIAFLRGWVFVCGNSDDGSMRLAGLFCSLLMLGAGLWAAQGRSRAVPWTTLILFGMSPVVITFGTEVRGYALGAAAQFWMLGSMQRWLLRPSIRAGVVLVIASVVAVQTAYANSFLLLAGSLSAGIICVSEKRWRAFLFLMANGVFCAATVSYYILVLLPSWTSDWVVVVRQEFPMSWYLLRMRDAFESGGPLPMLAWGLLCFAAAFGVKRRFNRSTESPNPTATGSSGPTGAFELLLLVCGTLLVLLYLKFLNVPTTDWYYLPILALWAFCLDNMIATWTPRPESPIFRLGTAMLLGAILFPATWRAANVRLTNVDLAAKAIAAIATEQDLVIAQPWYFGIPLQRYYHGSAPWISLPMVNTTEVPGTVIHADGYRAVKAAMMSKNSIAAELSRVRETLQRGGRVFVLGHVQLPRPGDPVIDLPPAPNSPHGWSDNAYQGLWRQQLGFELQAHSKEIHPVPLETLQSVNQYENCDLYVAEGRFDSSPQ